ncbi:hypothetical protein MVEN_01113100 [Mycena venus]|uniref:DUF6593 domain-containing protein n=1 Tax=Mycena venus TaxID=2733690 RepID=A0A8H7D031_9AGAR|nr:hypothetical protein MVEN_01113100 [Mycena venus]
MTSPNLKSRAISLVFESNSMLATTIFQNAVPVYRVSTSTHGSTTEIRTTGTDMLIARIARKEIFPSTVTFPDMNGEKSIKISKWLKPSELPDGLTAATLQTPIGDFVLGGHPEYTLALYTPDITTLIAHWSQKTSNASSTSPPTLIIASGYEGAHAQILAAFVYEEQEIRIARKNGDVAQGVAQMLGKYPYLKFGGGGIM